MIANFLFFFWCHYLYGKEHLGRTDQSTNSLIDSPEIFLATEVSKEIVYQGEGIDVRYYLYYQYYQPRIIQKEFLSYPQFDSFIKRFIHPDNLVETVEHQGKKYQRSLEYQVRLFPEEVGKLSISALSSRVYYLKSGGNSFGQFGQQFQHQVSEDLTSPVKEITVLPLPLERRPSSFLGLVGKHQIKINMEKKVFTTNAPIEIGLTISGPGALEKLDPPILLTASGLEQFHTKGELLYQDQLISTRKFLYTYIAQKELRLEEQILEFFYFDSDLAEYKSVEVRLPELAIQSDLPSSALPGTKTIEPKLSPAEVRPVEQIETGILPPEFTSPPYFLQLVDGLIVLFWSILLVVVFLIVSPLFFRITANDRALKLKLRPLARSGISYQELFDLLAPFGRGQNLKDLIISLSFEPGVSKYLLDLVDKLTEKSYFTISGTISDTTQIKIEKKYIAKIFSTLRNNGNNRKDQSAKKTI